MELTLIKHDAIATRLIQYIFNSELDSLDMKVDKIDMADGYLTFTVKFSSITDKELSAALKSCAANIVNVIPWHDREVIGLAMVSRNLSKFIPVFTEVVETGYELVINGDDMKFGFGANDKVMSFRMHVNLLYNLFVNAAIFSVKN